jgi:hypothetical protein
MTKHQSVSSKLLGAWAPLAHAANAGSPSREARKGFLFRRESEVGGTKECRQIVYGTAALKQLKREFLKNAQVRELSSEEALQECLRAQVVPFWPAPTSGPSNRVAKPRRPRLLNAVQCWRRPEVELSSTSTRTVYMGFSDPRTVEATVLGWLPFVDEIVLVKPSPRRLRSTKSGARNWITRWPMPAFLKRLQGSCREWIP